jgi:hypothetical protein
MIPNVPYDWLVWQMLYVTASHKPVTVTVGLDGFGGVIETPLTVDLALAWAERLASERLDG